MMSNTSAPNFSTSFLAYTGPMPFDQPAAEVASRSPSSVPGSEVVISSARNWAPYCSSSCHAPRATICSPGFGAATRPTTVTNRLRPFGFTLKTP